MDKKTREIINRYQEALNLGFMETIDAGAITLTELNEDEYERAKTNGRIAAKWIQIFANLQRKV